MISKHKFLKESKEIGLSKKEAGEFYDAFEKMLDILKGKKLKWEDLSELEWQLLLKMEEESQWPVLGKLSDPAHKIYSEVDEKKKKEASSFLNSIQEEFHLRENRRSFSLNDFILGRKILIRQRFDYLLTIFEVDKRKLWRSLALFALAGGAVVTGTALIIGKIRGNNDANKKEKK